MANARPSRPVLTLVHYWWPLVLGGSVTAVVHRATIRSGNPVGVSVLLLGILAAYSLDRVVDPPAEGHPAWMQWTLLLVGLGSSGAAGILLWWLPPHTAALVPVLGIVAAMYPRIKKWALVKAVAVPLVWTWGAIALPFNDDSWVGWHSVTVPVAIPLLLLMASGCLLCDLKDEAEDRHRGVSSLPAILGPNATARAALVLAMGAGAIALVQQRTGIAVGALGLGFISVWPPLAAQGPLGALLVDVTLTLPGILVASRLV